MALEINNSTPVNVAKSIAIGTNAAPTPEDNIVNGFGGEDQITLPGDRVARAVIRGDDILFYTEKGYKFRLNNVKGHYIELHDSDGAHYKHYGGTYTYRPIDVIQKFMASLDKTTLSGSQALDAAIDACSSKFSTIKEAIAQCVADCKAAGDANTFLRKYCGIELSDKDTGAITGWDAANPDSKNNEDVVPETGSMKTFSGSSFTVNGLKLTVPSNLTSAQKTVINGLYTWWAKEGLNLVAESYGDNYGFSSASSATVKEMNVEFVNSKDNFLALVRYYYDPKSGKTLQLTLQVNMRYYNSISATDVNGESSTAGAGLLDRTLAHEFTHAVMAANINFFNKLPNFIAEGMAELTHGIDDHRYSDIVKLAGNSSQLSKYLNVSDTKSSTSSVYAAGYIFLRYLAKQSAIFEKDYVETFDDWDDPPFAEEGEAGVAYSDSKYTKLIVSDFLGLVDAANFNLKLVTIDAASDTQLVALVGNKNANVLRAGTAGASMDGGTGNDKLYGGSGVDTFSYSLGGGNDTFYGYDGKGGDIVQILGDVTMNASSYKESGSTGILTVTNGKTKGTITFDKPDGWITIINANGETLATFNEPLPDGLSTDTKKTKLTIAKGAALESGAVVAADSYATTIKEIDASKFDKEIVLIGNALANTLRAGTAGASLDGGLGADKIYGGSGVDTFSYSVGGGNDTFYGFSGTGGDVVRIFGDDSITRSSFKESGSNIVMTVGSGKTKSTLTFEKPDGRITVINGDGETLATFNEPPPEGVTLDSKKTKLTVKEPFSGTIDLADYAATIKEVNATLDGNAVNIVGNASANTLRAGKGGGVLDGGLGDDKIYGGAGVDTFSYSVGGGNDTFYGFSGTGGDVVRIFGDDSITKANFKESGNNILMTVGSGKTKGTLTFEKPDGRITVINSDGETLATFNEPPPEGVTLDSKKTKLTVKEPFSGTIDLADYASTVKEVNATLDANTVNIIGNDLANTLRAGKGGGVLDGGLGADKIYGGSGVDTFSYSLGGGNDTFYSFSGTGGDVVQILGDVTLNASSYKESGKNGILTVGSGKTKGTITFDKPDGQITVIDGGGNTIGAFNVPLPDGLTTDTKKTKLTIAKGAALTAGAVVEADSIATTLKEIDASKFDKSIKLVGNASANTLRAGTAGASLDGGLGADKLYGGSGVDTFSYSIGGGNDTFYSFDGTNGDVVQILGDVTLNASSYKESGKNGILTITSGKTKGTLTFDKPDGQITIIDGDGTTLATYNVPLPDGVTLDSKKTKMTVKEPFGGTIDLSSYAATIKEVNATLDANTVNIVGNDLANTLRAGKGGGVLDGGLGADKLIGGAGIDTFIYNDGGGKDTVTGCDENDVIKIGGTVKSSSVSGKNVILTVGSVSIIVTDAVDKMLTIDINGTVNDYKFNKSNNTLAKAAANASNSQLPSDIDDYWFVADAPIDPLDDPLDSILEIKAVAIDEPLSIGNIQPASNTFASTTTLRSRHNGAAKNISY